MTDEMKTPEANAQSQADAAVPCAVVTGSSRGIGAAIIEELAGDAMNVCINCSSENGRERAEAFAADVETRFGVKAIAVVADVSTAEGANALIEAAKDAFGRVDVLVNNAGITRDALIMRIKDEDFDAVIDTNLKGTFYCCRAVSKFMMKQRYGRIVNMSSVVGIYGNAGQVNYAASKAGVIGITKSLAKELAPRNVTVNAVAPGFVSTSMTDALSDKQRESIFARIGMGRFGDPTDIAHVVGFLASESAAYVTGQVIAVDGGLSL